MELVVPPVPHRARLAVLLAVALGSASPVRGQAATRPGSCLDTLSASDTVAAAVTLSVRARGKERLPDDFEMFFAADFRKHFVVPTNLELAVIAADGVCAPGRTSCTKGRSTLASTAYAVARPDGTLESMEIVDRSLTPVLAASLKAALAAMNAERLVPPISGKSIPLVITLGAETNYDSVPPQRRLFRVLLPRYDLTFTPPGHALDPVRLQYPVSAKLAGVGDTVTVTFTVRSDGSVAPMSFDLHKGRYREFAEEVFRALLQSQYRAGRIGNCPVATWASQTFYFAIP